MNDVIAIVSISISALTALTALLVPIVTTCVNNKHQRKIHKSEFLLEKRYIKYQAMFDFYVNYKNTNQFDEELLSKIIADCLPIASKGTRFRLQQLLEKNPNINSQMSYINKNVPLDCCIEEMRKDLDIS